jgi:D-amino-acid dehydrogenase
MREVVVMGAGVIGMTSAYSLARKGYPVTVIDAAKGPAEGGASYGNGAQIAYGYTDAMASPSIIYNLPKYILGRDPAFRIRLNMSLPFLKWGLRFLANSTQSNFEKNTLEALRLASQSREGFAEFVGKISYDERTNGKLNLYSSMEAIRGAETLSALKNKHGTHQRVLSKQEALEREPALHHYGHSFEGALWSPDDESGDSYKFCQKLMQLLKDDYSVRFLFNTRINKIIVKDKKLRSIVTDRGEISCQRAVLALGHGSAPLARTAGISLPIWPVQGYSMTADATEYAPQASVTDTARKVVFCRIGDRIRIGGLADIAGETGNFEQKRFDYLLNTAREIFPKAANYDGEIDPWCGFRPVTPNSLPIVGSSKVNGLYLNCGHGGLGWTLSMACAQMLAEAIDA